MTWQSPRMPHHDDGPMEGHREADAVELCGAERRSVRGVWRTRAQEHGHSRSALL